MHDGIEQATGLLSIYRFYLNRNGIEVITLSSWLIPIHTYRCTLTLRILKWGGVITGVYRVWQLVVGLLHVHVHMFVHTYNTSIDTFCVLFCNDSWNDKRKSTEVQMTYCTSLHYITGNVVTNFAMSELWQCVHDTCHTYILLMTRNQFSKIWKKNSLTPVMPLNLLSRDTWTIIDSL